MTTMQQISAAQTSPEIVLNENFESLEHQATYGKNPDTTSGLTWGYYGGRWGGFSVSAGTFTLSASATNYIVVAISTGVTTCTSSSTNWDNSAAYARVYKITAGTAAVTAVEDHRAGPGGVQGGSGATGSTPTATPVLIQVACSDESTLLTTGTAKATFRAPYAFTLTDVRGSLTEAATGGTLLTVDVNESGTTVLSTKLTFDASEKTTTTAATPRVISDSAIADDAEITIDVDAIGSTLAGKGLKVTLIGTKP